MPTTSSRPARGRPAYSRRARAASAITPPSPSLSARMITPTYFTETITVIDHTISDTTPYTSLGVGRTAPPSIENTVCNAYSGLVPISPNTTPSEATSSAAPPAPRRPADRSSSESESAAAADDAAEAAGEPVTPTRSHDQPQAASNSRSEYFHIKGHCRPKPPQRCSGTDHRKRLRRGRLPATGDNLRGIACERPIHVQEFDRGSQVRDLQRRQG